MVKNVLILSDKKKRGRFIGDANFFFLKNLQIPESNMAQKQENIVQIAVIFFD